MSIQGEKCNTFHGFLFKAKVITSIFVLLIHLFTLQNLIQLFKNCFTIVQELFSILFYFIFLLLGNCILILTLENLKIINMDIFESCLQK